MQTPTAIYVRLSQDRTGAGLGVARQETECRNLVERMPDHDVVQVFTDNDVSAYSGKPRPGYLALLQAISDGTVQAVVAWHTDRLHRSPTELEAYIDAGAPTFTVSSGPLDLATPAGRMTARTLGAVARYEMEQKSERQKAKNRQTAATGAPPPGGPIPFGYNDDRLTVHPERGQMVRDAYRDLLQGKSLGSVIRTWNASDQKAPRGGRWSYSTVRGVLSRPLNAGVVQYDGAVLDVRGSWEPLVSEEDYYALTALLASPERRTTDGKEKKHLLAGIATCGNCHGPLKSGSVGKEREDGKGKSYLYRCNNYGCSARVSVARDQLNDLVVSSFLSERGGMQAFTTSMADNGGALRDVENRIKGVTARLGDDGADVDQLLGDLARLKAERKDLQDSAGEVRISAQTVRQTWEKCSTVNERQALLRQHLTTLSVASRGKTSHRFDPDRVTLEWGPFPGSYRLHLKGSADTLRVVH